MTFISSSIVCTHRIFFQKKKTYENKNVKKNPCLCKLTPSRATRSIKVKLKIHINR